MKSKPAMEPQKAIVPVGLEIESMDNLADRLRDIYQSIEQRAYELFEARGREYGHDMDDWLRAEEEMLLPVQLEITEADDNLKVHAEVPGFDQKEMHVGVGPRLLWIIGESEQQTSLENEESAHAARRFKQMLYTLDLPVEVDPAGAKATLHYGVLDITLPKAVTGAAAE